MGLILKFEKACRDSKKRLPFSVRLEPKLDTWWDELHEVDNRRKNGRRRRTGQAIAEITNAPCWKTFKRDYEKFVASGRNPRRVRAASPWPGPPHGDRRAALASCFTRRWRVNI